MNVAAEETLAVEHAAGREYLTNEMVREARTALACYGAGNTPAYHAHRTRARELAVLLDIPVLPQRDARGEPVDWTLQSR